MCAFYLSDVSRGREPNRRLAFGKRLRFLALCSVSILAVTLCRFAIYLKTALCRAAPLTSCPLTSIRYCERVRSKGQRTQPQVCVRKTLAFSCVMQRELSQNRFLLMPTDNNIFHYPRFICSKQCFIALFCVLRRGLYILNFYKKRRNSLTLAS